MRKSRTVEERFWEKVDRSGGPDACWEWHGAGPLNAGGQKRGQLEVFGRKVLSHRLAYELYYGVTPSKKTVICHTCDNPLCCNPHHLMLSSQKANAVDAGRKGRLGRSHSRMPDDVVRQAHQMRLVGLGMISIGRILGVNPSTVQNWMCGATRHNVYEEFYGAGAA